jgi:hypothetical protein
VNLLERRVQGRERVALSIFIISSSKTQKRPKEKGEEKMLKMSKYRSFQAVIIDEVRPVLVDQPVITPQSLRESSVKAQRQIAKGSWINQEPGWMYRSCTYAANARPSWKDILKLWTLQPA